MDHVLITGSAGRLGSVLARGLQDKYVIRGFDRKPSPEVKDVVVADLGDKGALAEAARGVDAIIHLAASASGNQSWETMLESNLIGTYHVFEAARMNGVRRVIFTSTCQVMFGYGEGVPVSWDMLPKPISYYGVGKVAGEALGCMYAEQFGLEVLCIRIGHFPSSLRAIRGRPLKGRYLSPRDAVQLYEKALSCAGIKFEIVYGASNSGKGVFDLAHTKEILGYEPLDWEEEAVGPGE